LTDSLIKKMNDEYSLYLREESRSTGYAEGIAFPQTEDDVLSCITKALNKNLQLTIQGARTGLTAGAVPQGGLIINFSHMNKMTALRYNENDNTFVLTVEPGITLTRLREAVATGNFATGAWSKESLAALDKYRQNTNYFFTPDPTEASATLGGMAACNASGARTFGFGPTRVAVCGLTVALSDASLLHIKRGEHFAQGRYFSLTSGKGKLISGELPSYHMPETKNAAGYYIKDDMDLIDLFIGSEGSLGIITSLELLLIPQMKEIWGITTFFPEEKDALNFVEQLHSQEAKCFLPKAIEYFNEGALNFLRREKENGTGLEQIPSLPAGFGSAVYSEFHTNDREDMLRLLKKLSEIIAACGGNADVTWVATTPADYNKLMAFRHATPECVNMTIDRRKKAEPRLTKLGTDMSVPDQYLKEVMAMYNHDLTAAGLEYVIFGHIGNNHLHVNILPNDLGEYQKGKELYLKWARQIVAWGGTVAAEHGIGKLKASFLPVMYGKDGVCQMRRLKELFDPQYIFNSGNLFSRKDD